MTLLEIEDALTDEEELGQQNGMTVKCSWCGEIIRLNGSELALAIMRGLLRANAGGISAGAASESGAQERQRSVGCCVDQDRYSSSICFPYRASITLRFTFKVGEFTAIDRKLFCQQGHAPHPLIIGQVGRNRRHVPLTILIAALCSLSSA
jgi:hypothetical protein